MSKKSCKAAESIEDALLRMARVNSNKIHYSSLVPFAYKIDGNRKRCKWLADSSNDRVVSRKIQFIILLIDDSQVILKEAVKISRNRLI